MTAREKLQLALRVAEERKAQEPVSLDLTKLTLVADYFVICHGTSDTHLRGLADAFLERFHEAGLKPLGCEGYRQARWILLDFGEVVIHVFAPEEREYYGLERLWGGAPRLKSA